MLIFACDRRRLSRRRAGGRARLVAPLAPPAPLVALVALLACAAAATIPGCGSTCGSNCPTTTFDTFATSGENLNVTSAQWTGPGCPRDSTPLCRGDLSNTCVRFAISGSQPGTCRLDLVFNDGRAPFSVETEFGPETHQGCCRGFPVIGPTSVTVPPLHPVAGPDAGTDAGVDAGADAEAEAGADAG